jgi:hypothetical protein
MEEDGVIQRNRLLLEHVICERKKEQATTLIAKEVEIAREKKKRPPSQLEKAFHKDYSRRATAERIEHISCMKRLSEEENGMVFLKNERLVYF